METESNGRKVLLSIKVSTLLMIILTMIVTIVTINVVRDKVISKTNEEIQKELAAEIVSTNDAVAEMDGETNPVNDRFHVTTRSIDRRELQNLITPPPPTTPIEEVTISRDMDLTVRTGLSREDFIKLMTDLNEDTSGFFEENAGLIFDYCEQYQINEIFFVGLISAESGWNIASNHRRTFNYISLMSHSGLIRFSSVEDGLESAARTLHDNYLTPGGRFYYGSTLSGVKTRFCPASPTWVNLVYGRMEQVLN